jgi:hypothetical protein
VLIGGLLFLLDDNAAAGCADGKREEAMQDKVPSVIATPLGRRVQHPGPLSAARRHSHAAPAADEFRLVLPPGAVLFDAIIEAFTELGVHHANLQLFDADLAEACYQTAPPDPSCKLIIAYGPPIVLPGGGRIVMGNATVGRTAEHKPLIHCHGVLRDRQGRLHGGHFPTQLCVIGSEGIPVWAVVSRDGGFVVRPDEETHFSLLMPCEEEK